MDPIIVDGQEMFTGLQLPPPGFSTSMPAFEDHEPQWTMDQIMAKAASTPKNGRKYFGKEWILNQNPKNSCAGHGGGSATAKARVRRGLPPVILSGAYPYSKANGHRDKGAQLEDIMNVLKTKGDAPLSLVPKNEIYPELQPANADAEAARYKADVIYAIKTIQGVWCALARDFDVVVAVMVGNRFGNLDGNAVAGFDHGAGNHCVHADGLYLVGSELTADGANSWDVTWGEQGRMGLQTKHFTEPFNYHTFYVVSSVIDDPQGTNPPVAQ